MAAMLLDKDLTREAVRPLVEHVLDNLASSMGANVLQAQLPITVNVTTTLRSAERALMITTIKYEIEALASTN